MEKYWIGLLFWIIAFVLFVISHVAGWPNGIAAVFLALIVVGPALFYPVVYFKFSDTENDNNFVKSLAEMWGPFWAAVAAFSLFLSTQTNEPTPKEPPTSTPTGSEKSEDGNAEGSLDTTK